jgi:hypothetical protein
MVPDAGVQTAAPHVCKLVKLLLHNATVFHKNGQEE